MKASHRQNLMERELISPLLQWRYNGRAAGIGTGRNVLAVNPRLLTRQGPSSTALGRCRRSRR